MIKVKFFSSIRDKAGTPSLELEANSLDELVEKIVKDREELRESLLEDTKNGWKIKSGISLMLNGRNIRFLDGLDTDLNEGDTVAIFPPVGGG